MKLYEIADNYNSLQELADQDQVPMDQLTDTFEMIEGEFNDKAHALLCVVENMNSSVNELDNQIKRLTARKKAIQNKQDNMREYLRDNMNRTGIDKIETPFFNITLAKASQQCEVVSVDDLPDDYVEVKTTVTADKKRILADLKKGVDIPGAKLIDGKRALRIKV